MPFTAIDSISNLDNVSFSLARKGSYGTHIRKEAIWISNEPLPVSTDNRTKMKTIFQKNFSILVLIAMFILATILVSRQLRGVFFYKEIRITFIENEVAPLDV